MASKSTPSVPRLTRAQRAFFVLDFDKTTDEKADADEDFEKKGTGEPFVNDEGVTVDPSTFS